MAPRRSQMASRGPQEAPRGPPRGLLLLLVLLLILLPPLILPLFLSPPYTAALLRLEAVEMLDSGAGERRGDGL